MMKAQRSTITALVAASLAACGATAHPLPTPEPERTDKATLIRLTADPGSESALEGFLKQGGDIVAKTEPSTLLWWALRQEDAEDRFAIFDLFPDQAGRDAHFNGDVAKALEQRAPTLVQGGWQSGVLPNVEHFGTLAAKLPDAPVTVTKATVIVLTAAPGKAGELEQFLIQGRDVVAKTEPNTPYWFALKAEASGDTFAIVDLFPDQQGRDEHFAGGVAAALKDNADALVRGGWDGGVLANVVHFDVVATK